MHPRGVVEPLDVAKHAALGFFSGLKAPPVRLLHLQAVLEALHRRVIKTVALSTHRLPVAHPLQVILSVVRSVLTAFVRMKNQSTHTGLLGESVEVAPLVKTVSGRC